MSLGRIQIILPLAAMPSFWFSLRTMDLILLRAFHWPTRYRPTQVWCPLTRTPARPSIVVMLRIARSAVFLRARRLVFRLLIMLGTLLTAPRLTIRRPSPVRLPRGTAQTIHRLQR